MVSVSPDVDRETRQKRAMRVTRVLSSFQSGYALQHITALMFCVWLCSVVVAVAVFPLLSMFLGW